MNRGTLESWSQKGLRSLRRAQFKLLSDRFTLDHLAPRVLNIRMRSSFALRVPARVLWLAAALLAGSFLALVPAFGEAAKDDIIPKYDKVNQARRLLTPDEITTALQRLPGWKAQDGKLTKTFVRKNFLAAIAFINAFAPECEKLDHHPEIFSVYNKVVLTLTTFDAGQKISSRDVELAERIEAATAKL